MFERFSHTRRIKALEEAVEKLQRDFQGLEMEWLNTQHKMKSIIGRVTKSEALAQEREDAMMGIPPKAGGPSLLPQAPGAPHGMLTPRQREIQQEILKRRAGG